MLSTLFQIVHRLDQRLFQRLYLCLRPEGKSPREEGCRLAVERLVE